MLKISKVNLELSLDPSHHSLSMEDLTLGSWSVGNKSSES
jgi:hypothetical protein